jgi:phosphoenolpyruvate synthase/pyruvate phosphate dikinase
MNLTISFPGAEQANLTEVGGKGYSLIRMVEAGLHVFHPALCSRRNFRT